MVIDELLQVLKIPERPIESGLNKNWGLVTAKLGGPLPTDYMQFIDRFGSGSVNDFLTPFNPFSQNPNVNLFEQLFIQLSALRDLRAEFPESIPYPLFFEPGGLFPWGLSIDGDVFCWLSKGTSGRWPVVVLPRHGETEHFSISMTQFIARCITGDITSRAIPSPFFVQGKAQFLPFEDSP